jgi:hypothetical protein
MADTWYGRQENGHVRDASKITGVILNQIRCVLDVFCNLIDDPKCVECRPYIYICAHGVGGHACNLKSQVMLAVRTHSYPELASSLYVYKFG